MATNLLKYKEYYKNFTQDIKDDWNEYKQSYEEKNSTGVQLHLDMLILGYRSKAILHYLIDGDRFGFFENCFFASKTYDLNNDYCRLGMPHDTNLYSLSNSKGFFSSLISMPIKKSGIIAQLMPRECQYTDDIIKFVFVGFLVRCTQKNWEEHQYNSIVELKELHSEGKNSEIEIGIAEGLYDRDKKKFIESMEQYIDRRQTEIENYEDATIGDEYISLESLGLIRFAQELGMDITIDHKLTPIDLQSNYPDVNSFSLNEIPLAKKEIIEPEFWKDWKPFVSL